ncbi:hypothetical protein BC834DRAFT_959000 [Gloeopeniophorella convolvens]|nr:hypothetical protein BC834DRAFT_959000 [Gloeopeniophorella convolvens]
MTLFHPPSEPTPPEGVSSAPPAWDLKAQLYLFMAPVTPANREDPVLQGLPTGSYDPLEQVHPAALAPVNGAPQWKGGAANVVLVRYADSPVGPYDELIFIVTGFASPHEKGTAGRITAIYVSTDKSVWNGRRNWNIQKHRARFDFAPTGKRSSSVRVFLPDAEKPFFTASVSESALPGLPVPSFLLNSIARLVQPPLLVSEPKDTAIGTFGKWLSITPSYRGRWRLAYIQQAEDGNEGYGDGINYPRIKPRWIGGRFDGIVHFPFATIVGEE